MERRPASRRIGMKKTRPKPASKLPRSPHGRVALKVGEFAAAWGVSENHVINLIEEGSLLGIDISSGGGEYLRIHSSAVPVLAKASGLTESEVLRLIRQAKPRLRRSIWRIPVEGWDQLVKDRGSVPEIRSTKSQFYTQ